MQKYTFLNKAASIAVCFGILLSNSGLAFADGRSTVPRDVELSREGALRGQVLTSDQQPVENAQVELRFKGHTVARTTTGAQGEFLITEVRGGAHEVSVGSMNSQVRIWKYGTAPETALNGIVISASESVVRGQAYDPYYQYEEGWAYGQPGSGFGLADVVALAVIGAAATAVVIAIEEHNDDAPAPAVSP